MSSELCILRRKYIVAKTSTSHLPESQSLPITIVDLSHHYEWNPARYHIEA